MNIEDHDHRQREPKANEYRVKSFIVGDIVCVTPGVRLIDFYRTSSVLAKDVPPKVSGGKGGVD